MGDPCPPRRFSPRWDARAALVEDELGSPVAIRDPSRSEQIHLRRADKRSSAIATELARASHVILANQRALDPGRS
jgi:hypothetical protein